MASLLTSGPKASVIKSILKSIENIDIISGAT